MKIEFLNETGWYSLDRALLIPLLLSLSACQGIGSNTGTLNSTASVSASGTTAATAGLGLATYMVSASGTNVTISPNTQAAHSGSTSTFIVTPTMGYTLSNTVGGTCKPGSWNGNSYTTGLIIASCSVMFSASINTYSVTSSGANVTIAPSAPQTVNYGSTQSFTLAATTGYTLSGTMGGTCAAGAFVGSTYTTGPVTANCTVVFNSTINTYSITPSGTNVTINPGTAQTVNYGTTKAFTVTPTTGYTLSNTVGGTCTAGSFSGNVYTTGAITANCTVTFNATINSYSITPSGTNVTINPSTAQTVNYGLTHAFTVTPTTGYTLSNTVGGTCTAGSFNGNVYTTGAITANCSVVFSAMINTYSVTPSGTNVTINPGTAQTVNYGTTKAFAVTANSGYLLSSAVSGTCTAGSFNGGTYTTGAITANCTVVFSATASPPSAAVGIFASYFDPEAATTLVSYFTLTGGTLPQALNLGTVAVGDQNMPTATFVVQNNGAGSLNLSNLTIPSPFAQASGFSASTLASGAQATFQVTVPSASAGTFTGNITFRTNDPQNATVTVPIQGVAQ